MPALRKPSVRWFRLWICADFGVSVFAYLIRHEGKAYADFWQASFPLLILLLIVACLETAPSLASIKIPAIVALVATAAIHAMLSLPHRWPGSWLETVESFGAAWSLLCGLTLAPLWRQCRHSGQALVLCLYCLGKAVCYYAAPAYPQTVGRAVVGVSLACMIAWVAVFSRKDQYFS